MPTPRSIVRAMKHVRDYYPEVTHVAYSREGRWYYFGEDFSGPTFGPEIDISFLEEAANDAPYLPFIYAVEEA